MKFAIAIAIVAAAGVYAGIEIGDNPQPTKWPCAEDEVIAYARYIEDAPCVHIDQV